MFTRQIKSETAIALSTIRLTMAMQVVRSIDCARQRPLLFVTPYIVTHNEDAYGRVVVRCNGLTMQVPIKPRNGWRDTRRAVITRSSSIGKPYCISMSPWTNN